MNVTGLFRDDRSVSSVVSVILIVAMTVILSATVAGLALGITESISADVPVASFSAEQDTKRLEAKYDHAGDFYVLEISYTNGEPIPEDQLSVQVNGRQAWGVNTVTTFRGPTSEASTLLSDSSSSFRPGETLTVVHTDDPSITISNGDPYIINVDDNPDNPVDGENDPEENRLFHSPNHPGGPQLQLEPGDRITIYWESERGDETAVLFEREIVSIN